MNVLSLHAYSVICINHVKVGGCVLRRLGTIRTGELD